MHGVYLDIRVEFARSVFCYKSFRLLDVGVSEEELTVEIRKIDGIEVDYVDFSKACSDEVLE